jgi:hypothetical protein
MIGWLIRKYVRAEIDAYMTEKKLAVRVRRPATRKASVNDDGLDGLAHVPGTPLVSMSADFIPGLNGAGD